MFRRRCALGTLLTWGVLVGAACESTPTTPSEETTTSTTITFSSKLFPGLYTWRSFQVARAGTVTLQLVSLSPDSEGVVGLGLGIFDGTNCLISSQVETAPGTEPQISTSLPVGNYCAKVSELGSLTRTQDLSVSIVTP
jgi:hypothetical protein